MAIIDVKIYLPLRDNWIVTRGKFVPGVIYLCSVEFKRGDEAVTVGLDLSKKIFISTPPVVVSRDDVLEIVHLINVANLKQITHRLCSCAHER